MPRRIEEDHKDFRDIYSGRIRKELKKFVSNGTIFKSRGKDGKIKITIPKIDIPHIVFGSGDNGVGRGAGKKGDVVGRDGDGDGQGDKAGDKSQEGIEINIDLEEVFKFLKQELQLPDLKPKPNQTYEDIIIKYNNISMNGPESLRHNRRTMLQALKRMCASGDINKLHTIPGSADKMRLITPINSDRRYRQYREIRVPSSNAVIFFVRDGSGSMDQYKCDIVSDMAWWIDLFVRHYYKRTECCYIWHDTEAQEVDQNKFYRYRYGGGTICSSGLKYVGKQFKHRFPPEKWNVYVIYFSDGENFGNDNKVFNDYIKTNFPPEIVNMVGVVQILCWYYNESLKQSVDKSKHAPNVRSTSIGPEDTPDMSQSNGYYHGVQLSDEQRNEQIKRAIIDLLGAGVKPKKSENISSEM
jgi:uncharacterized sporulation protein YeaH/YhbH (DUF444 family)